MRMIPFQSSNVAGVAYDPDQEELYAQFQNGSWYKYKGVDGDTVLGVIFDPDSQGKAFNAKIKNGNYPFTKLEEAPDYHV